MEDNVKMIETLIEKATDYGKTSIELIKLKTIDKTANVISTLIPKVYAFIAIVSFIFFVNIALALWLGEIIGKVFYGFLLVSLLYGFIAILLHYFLDNSIKKQIHNSIIKQLLT